MNLPTTSKEKIIETCQKMVEEQGITAINMRSVAVACHVSVGAMYNYFPSKSELLCATIESIWKDIFPMPNQLVQSTSFLECLTWLFENIQEGCKKYPEFLSRHALTFATENKELGHKVMDRYFTHVKQGLYDVLEKDQKIKKYVFNDIFDSTLYVDYIFELFLSSISSSRQDAQGILEFVRLYLYEYTKSEEFNILK